MIISIEIDDKEIMDEVMALVVKRTVDSIEKDIYGDRGSYSKHVYVDAIKDAVRETVKKNAEDIISRGVTYAGEYIGKKGLKKMIDEGSI